MARRGKRLSGWAAYALAAATAAAMTVELAQARGFGGGFRPAGGFRPSGGGDFAARTDVVPRPADNGGGAVGPNNVNVNNFNRAYGEPGYWHPYYNGGYGAGFGAGLAAGSVADAVAYNSAAAAYVPAPVVYQAAAGNPSEGNDDGVDSADPTNPNAGILSASTPAPPAPFLAPTYIGPAQPPPPPSAPLYYADPAPPCAPAQPQGVSAAASAQGMLLQWAPPADASCLGSYSVSVLPANGGTAAATPLATFTAPANAASFSVPGSILAPGTTYTFGVQALSPAGVGSPAAYVASAWGW